MDGNSESESWDEEPGELQWVQDARYVKGWVEARDAAEEWNAVLAELGACEGELWARPRTSEAGRGEVRLKGTPADVRWAARMLRRGAGAPPERDAG